MVRSEKRYKGKMSYGDGIAVATEDHNNNNERQDSNSRESLDLGKESSRSMEKYMEKGRDEDRGKGLREKHRDRSSERDGEKSRDRELGRHQRDRPRSEKRERESERESLDLGKESSRSREKYMEKGRDTDRGKGLREKHRERDRSSEREWERQLSEKRKRESDDHHKSGDCDRRPRHKRVSGFDVAPASAMLGATAGQVLSMPPNANITSKYPIVHGQQRGALPQMPVQPSELPKLQFQNMTQQATRHPRRVNVSGFCPSANEQSIAAFFNEAMNALSGTTDRSGDFVVNVQMNYQKKFAVVEMHTVQQASAAMSLNGKLDKEGFRVSVRRPSDYYNPFLASEHGPNLNLFDCILETSQRVDGPYNVLVDGFPCYFGEAQIRELLESFGALKCFHRDSKGCVYCAYEDSSGKEIVEDGLDGMQLGDNILRVNPHEREKGKAKAKTRWLTFPVYSNVEHLRNAF